MEGWGTVGQGFFPAIALIVKWLHDWQALLTGVCAVIAAHVWGRTVIRAAELRASAIRPNRSPVPRQTPSVAGPPSRDLRLQQSEIATLSAPESVEKLRIQIRNLLGRVPHSDEPLNASQLSLCKGISTFSLDEASLKRDAPREAYATLKGELAELGNLTKGASCMTAWKALTAVNKGARDLEAALQGEAVSTR
jgi:hypothetical protein